MSRRLGAASAGMFVATAVINVSGLVYHRILSQSLGTAYAQLAALLALSSVLSNVTLGLNTYLVKAFAADAELSGPATVKGRLRALGPRGLGAVAGVLALLLLAAPPLAAYLKLPSGGLTALVMVLFAGSIVLLTLRAAVQGLHHFGALGLSLAGEGLGRVAGAWFLGSSVAGGLLAMLGGQALGMGFVAGGLRGLGPAHTPPRPAPPWRAVAGEAGGDTLALTLFAVLAFLDVLVLKHHYDEGRAALYGRAALVAKSFLYLASAFNLVLLPAAAREDAAGRDPRRLLWRFLGGALAVDLLGLAFVWAFTPLCLRTLLGPDPTFAALAPLVRWFCLAAIPLALLQLALAYLLALRIRGVVTAMALLCLAYWGLLERLWNDERAVVAALGAAAAVGLVLALAAAQSHKPQASVERAPA